MKGSQKRGEYSRVSTVELAKVTHEQMPRAKALQTLGLSGIPSPSLYDQKTQALIDDKSGLYQASAVFAAHSRLQKDHQAAVEDMLNTVNAAYTAFQSNIEPFIDQFSQNEQIIKQAGQKVIKLSREYCKKLSGIKVNIQELESAYKQEFTNTITAAISSLPEALQTHLKRELETLEAKITVAYAHVLDSAAENDMQDVEVNSEVDLFRGEFTYYLQSLEQIETKEQTDLQKAHHDANEPLIFPARYQATLKELHGTLRNLGTNYFTEIKKDNIDLQKIQQEFKRDFKVAVQKAKHAFAQEPGIWANLSCFCKFLAIICLCVPAIMIICAEKPEDRHRLFHGAPKGEMDMDTVWRDMQMDILPDPEGNDLKRTPGLPL